MKNCPQCGRANDESVLACVYCNAEFVAPDEIESPVDSDLTDPALSLVVVATFANVVDAGMLRLRLEAAGLEACIPEEYTPHIFWNMIPSPLEQVTVRVAAKDYPAAQAVAEEFARDRAEAEPVLENSPAVPAIPPPDPAHAKRCVRCAADISDTASECPHCGWTQPG